jgi:hypothetical protein
MDCSKELNRFSNWLDFEKFKELARNDELAPYEKVGFSQKHRGTSEHLIFPDVKRKLQLKDGDVILDKGYGF